jgi:hypothetical protein
MMRLKLTTFAVGLALSVLLGYFPWRYAADYETFRLNFSPVFATDYCTQFGYFLKSVSLLIWASALIVFGYLFYKELSITRHKAT